MNASWKLLAAVGLFCGASVATANPLTDRGYGNCVDDLEEAFPQHARLVHARYYYHAIGAGDMTYYVNSTAWQDGDRVALRTLCLTDRFGHQLLNRDTEPGRWARSRATVTVDEVSAR